MHEKCDMIWVESNDMALDIYFIILNQFVCIEILNNLSYGPVKFGASVYKEVL